MIATSAVESGFPFWGISGWSPAIISRSTLSSGLPGTIAGPPFAPSSSASGESSARDFPWASRSPWQCRQRRSRIGATLSRKS